MTAPLLHPPEESGEETELLVSGMTCHNCARHVADALRAVPGVRNAAVQLEKGTAAVSWHAKNGPDPSQLLAALDKAGYPAQLKTGEAPQGLRQVVSGWRFNVFFGLSITVGLMVLEWVFGVGLQRWYQWLSFAVVLPVQIFCGWRFYSGAWNQLQRGQSNMDTLVSLGSTTAFVYSLWGLFAGWTQHLYFMDAAAIITLVSAGHFLEEKVSARAASSLRALLNLAQETARRLTGGQEEIVPVADLRPGDRIALRAGDRVPTDAEVIEGSASLDESMLTGESLPVEKGVGSKVFAGTVNESGSVRCKITGIGAATALARIIQIVEQAQSSRARIQRLGDRVSSVFVPLVVFVAVATALVWGFLPDDAERLHTFLSAYLWHGHSPASPLAAAIFHSAAVLIIACPCAMGLATPIAIMAGTNAAARRGILIRDGSALEKSGTISSVIFDKTGTLTEGKLVVAASEILVPGALEIAASLASHSTHPISKAIATSAAKPSAFPEVREIRGSGLEGRSGQDLYRLGSSRWLAENAIDLSLADAFTSHWSGQGASVMGLARNRQLIALFALRDQPKAHASAVVAALEGLGQKIFLVSGDNRRTAEAIAAQVGIAPGNVRAEVRPEGKVAIIRELQQSGERVAFVGDGINDAPALQQADLGIALLNASDVAREAADIVLLRAGLEAIPEALQLAQRTLRTIKQNLFWAFFYNAVGVPLAALGFLSPIFSAFAMGMSDLLVVGNALRLRLRK